MLERLDRVPGWIQIPQYLRKPPLFNGWPVCANHEHAGKTQPKPADSSTPSEIRLQSNFVRNADVRAKSAKDPFAQIPLNYGNINI